MFLFVCIGYSYKNSSHKFVFVNKVCISFCCYFIHGIHECIQQNAVSERYSLLLVSTVSALVVRLIQWFFVLFCIQFSCILFWFIIAVRCWKHHTDWESENKADMFEWFLFLSGFLGCLHSSGIHSELWGTWWCKSLSCVSFSFIFIFLALDIFD